MGQRGEAVQVRGILPERIVLSTALDPYLPLRALATYSGLSTRTPTGARPGACIVGDDVVEQACRCSANSGRS